GNLLSSSPDLLIDAGDLLPGEFISVRFDMIARDPGLLSNTVTASDSTAMTVSANADIDVVVFDPFDPPFGTKIVNDDGLPELEWTMVWINPNTVYTMPLLVIDAIPANATYVVGSVTCVANGSSSIINCDYDSTNNQIVVNGLIGPDGNAQDATTANNEITITLRTRVDDLALEVINQGSAFWDEDGDGDISDDINSQTPSSTDEPIIPGLNDPTVWTHPLAQINGVVWLDTNENNLNDNGEDGLQNWTIEITDSIGVVITLMTDSDGAFAINNLLTDDYTITLYNSDGDLETQQSITLLADDVFTLLYPVPPEVIVAPPTPNSVKPVPTLAEWGRLLLMLLLILIATFQLHEKKLL
ncbi:MAG: hypothetical protein K0U68_01640, partial [Gammaproteobacteria bacterium]|nr:hypothetical protein [Gammaproteobacteria bacterium]